MNKTTMTKLELEKMFDDKLKQYTDDEDFMNYSAIEFAKKVFFETIILEILKSIIPKYLDTNTKDELINDMRWGYNNCTEEIKLKAKELYGITL